MILWTPNLQHFGTGGGFKESANASVAVDVECGNIMEHPCDKKNVQTCKAWGANFPYACIGDILLQSQHPHSCNLVHDRIHPLACRPHMGQERKASPIGFKADIVLISSIGTNSVCECVCVSVCLCGNMSIYLVNGCHVYLYMGTQTIGTINECNEHQVP